MNVVIPMAGRGSRLASNSAGLPKPLLPINGRTMVAWALDSLRHLPVRRRIFVVLEEHQRDHGVSQVLEQYAGGDFELVLLPEVTEGQLCTVMAARDLIDPNDGLLIIGSDTFVDSNLHQAVANHAEDCRGIISVADVPGDRWSFARIDGSGAVVDVAEKQRISKWASTGMYYFSSGKQFIETADWILHQRQKTRGEYYVIPVYKRLIDLGCRIEICRENAMWDMGTPEALQRFQQFLDSRCVGRVP